MAKIKLVVPALAQEKSMCCWHTAALMIWGYWQQKSGRQGPMNSVAPVYEANTGLDASAQAFITLAKKTGMVCVPSRNTYTSEGLAAMLAEMRWFRSSGQPPGSNKLRPVVG